MSVMRTRWVGKTLVGFDWAGDGKWDWTSDKGDRHTDFASVAVCRRGDYPPVYRVTLGPICLSFARQEPEAPRCGDHMTGRSDCTCAIPSKPPAEHHEACPVRLRAERDEARRRQTCVCGRPAQDSGVVCYCGRQGTLVPS